MAILHTADGRPLLEGDEVRLLSGPRTGKIGLVVGFDVLGEKAIVIQYPKPIDNVLREAVDGSDVEVFQPVSAPESLEPLPVIKTVLQENGFAPLYMTCGVMLCLRLNEDGTVLTCVPKRSGISLRRMFETRYRRSMREAVEEVLKNSFVTRLPHLVKIGNSRLISEYLSATISPEMVDELRRSVSSACPA